MHRDHGLSERQACAALGLSRTVYRYEPKPRDDSPIIEALLGLADRYPRYGFGKLFAVLRRHGFRWNHKRVYRVYCLLKMNLRRKGKKRLPSRNPQPLAVPPCANVCWSIDFMHDALASGQRFRTFNVLDDFSRECLGDRSRYESASGKGIAGFGSDRGLARVACQAENGQRPGADFRAAGRLG